MAADHRLGRDGALTLLGRDLLSFLLALFFCVRPTLG